MLGTWAWRHQSSCPPRARTMSSGACLLRFCNSVQRCGLDISHFARSTPKYTAATRQQKGY